MKFFRILTVALILLMIALFFILTHQTDPQAMLLRQIESLDKHILPIILLITLLTVMSTSSGLPVFYLSVALGFYFPFLPALALAWSINLLSVMFTFYMVRRFFSDHIGKRYGDKKLTGKINRRIKKYGKWTVAISRAVYIFPTSLINLSFPLSKIKTRDYLAGTMLGLIPESLINVLSGYMLRHEMILLQAPRQNLIKIILIAGSILLFAAVLLYLKFRNQISKKRILQEIVPLIKE